MHPYLVTLTVDGKINYAEFLDRYKIEFGEYVTNSYIFSWFSEFVYGVGSRSWVSELGFGAGFRS